MKLLRNLAFALLLLVPASILVAQEQPAPSTPPDKSAQTEPTNQPSQPATSVTEELAHASNEAAGHEGKEEQEENAEFKQSPSVQFVAKITGLSLSAAYWLLVILNFAIIGGLIGWALKKNLPAMFRSRTESIRKSMDEARRASEDANKRLGEIEDRLSKLDSEISEMKQKAEADAAAEEQRVRASAEEDGRKIIAAAEQEIESAAKSARRELKAYAAELAISLAEKRIQVDKSTDEALVSTFVRQLGKDGR